MTTFALPNSISKVIVLFAQKTTTSEIKVFPNTSQISFLISNRHNNNCFQIESCYIFNEVHFYIEYCKWQNSLRNASFQLFTSHFSWYTFLLAEPKSWFTIYTIKFPTLWLEQSKIPSCRENTKTSNHFHVCTLYMS